MIELRLKEPVSLTAAASSEPGFRIADWIRLAGKQWSP